MAQRRPPMARLRDDSAEPQRRYFTTNLPNDCLLAKQLLLPWQRDSGRSAVSAFFGTATKTFDRGMTADAVGLCTQRNSVLALGVPGMVARNLMPSLRKCHVRVFHLRVPDTQAADRATPGKPLNCRTTRTSWNQCDGADPNPLPGHSTRCTA